MMQQDNSKHSLEIREITALAHEAYVQND